MLSDDELLDNVALLYLAGHETTVNLIGNGTLRPAAPPRPARAAPRRPCRSTPNAVEELLRYDSPVQFSPPHHARADARSLAWTSSRARFVHDRPGLRQPRSGRSSGDDAEPLDLTRADAARARVVRQRRPPLPRRRPRPARGPGRDRHARPALPRPRLVDGDPPEWNGRIVLRGLERLPVTLRLTAHGRRQPPSKRSLRGSSR